MFEILAWYMSKFLKWIKKTYHIKSTVFPQSGTNTRFVSWGKYFKSLSLGVFLCQAVFPSIHRLAQSSLFIFLKLSYKVWFFIIFLTNIFRHFKINFDRKEEDLTSSMLVKTSSVFFIFFINFRRVLISCGRICWQTFQVDHSGADQEKNSSRKLEARETQLARLTPTLPYFLQLKINSRITLASMLHSLCNIAYVT